jgi:hypothetical protein
MKLKPEIFYSPGPSYEDARKHSEEVDKSLGIEVEKIEGALLAYAQKRSPEGSHKTWGQKIHNGNQTWVGLSHQTLQTPYNELRQICELLAPIPESLVVDLGAGYGRLGLILSAYYPEVKFAGHEYVAERVAEGNRIFKKFNCKNAILLEQDLTSEKFDLPEAEYYFIYDYGTVPHIRNTLKQLEELALRRKFKVIARGKGTRSLVQYEHPWLSQVFPAIHEENFSIFSMSENL